MCASSCYNPFPKAITYQKSPAAAKLAITHHKDETITLKRGGGVHFIIYRYVIISINLLKCLLLMAELGLWTEGFDVQLTLFPTCWIVKTLSVIFVVIFSNSHYLFPETKQFVTEMERVDGLLLSGAQQQHQYFNSSDHATPAHKGMDVDFNNGVNVQDRVQFEADKQAVYRYFVIHKNLLFHLLTVLFDVQAPVVPFACSSSGEMWGSHKRRSWHKSCSSRPWNWCESFYSTWKRWKQDIDDWRCRSWWTGKPKQCTPECNITWQYVVFL